MTAAKHEIGLLILKDSATRERDLARHHGRYSAAKAQAIYREANLPGFLEDLFAPVLPITPETRVGR
jgi:hypothetical protein